MLYEMPAEPRTRENGGMSLNLERERLGLSAFELAHYTHWLRNRNLGYEYRGTSEESNMYVICYVFRFKCDMLARTFIVHER
jgi:hypothetical protein